MARFYKGKIILTGEHSVVYGYHAILASLKLGVSCLIEEGCLSEQQKNDSYLQYILKVFSQFSQTQDFKISLKIDSNLPIKSGLGSSAAFAAAVFSELCKFYKYPLSVDQLYQLVFKAENFVHGLSSGADPSTVVYGGLIIFKNGRIKQLKTSVLRNKTFFLINSGVASESTGEMVTKVAKDQSNRKNLAKLGALSKTILNNLEKDCFNPQLLNENQLLLEQIGVVGQQARQLIKRLQQLSASCKVTGAGGIKTGSGYILAFHEEPEKFEKNLKNMNLDYFKTQLGDKK